MIALLLVAMFAYWMVVFFGNQKLSTKIIMGIIGLIVPGGAIMFVIVGIIALFFKIIGAVGGNKAG